LARTVDFAGTRIWLTGVWLAGAGFRLDGAAGLHRRLAGTSGLDGRLAGTVNFAGTRVWLDGLSCTDWLHGWTSDRGDRTGRGDQSRTALVHVIELLAILGSLALVLILRGHGRDAGAAVSCDLGGLRTNVDAAATAVIGDAVDGGVVDHDRAVVDVSDARDVDVVD
jgi:hypothetical protein